MAGTVPGVDGTGRTAERRSGPGAGRQMRGPGAIGPEFRALDLTDDQQAQLRKIREARQSEFKAAGEKLGAARQGMRALIEADDDQRVGDSRQERGSGGGGSGSGDSQRESSR